MSPVISFAGATAGCHRCATLHLSECPNVVPSEVARFARKLREYRAANGRHGRMTQEELAELLDVSVDAIGKYERSVSFIRGDIEHRLASKLGWNRQEIMECREDWESRQSSSGRRNYRVLEEVLVEELYDGSWLKASRAAIEMAQAELRPLPNGLEADIDVFLPIYETFRDHWGGIMLGNRMVAKWALPFLLPEQEARFRAGQLIEAELPGSEPAGDIAWVLFRLLPGLDHSARPRGCQFPASLVVRQVPG